MCKYVKIEIDSIFLFFFRNDKIYSKFSANAIEFFSSFPIELHTNSHFSPLEKGEKKRRAPPTRWFPAFRVVQVVNKMANKLSGQWGGWWKSIDGFVAGGGKRNFIIAFVMRFLLYCLQAIVRLEVYREWNGQRVQCRRLFAIRIQHPRNLLSDAWRIFLLHALANDSFPLPR